MFTRKMEPNIIHASVFMAIAIIFAIFRPKKMNGVFGYRTPRSKKSMENWNYAQKLSSSLLLVFTVPILLLTFLLEYLNVQLNVVLVFIIPAFILTIVIVEYKLWQRGK